MNMLKKESNFKFGLSNFRVFNKRQDFELAPITMLIGPNNSGKSSVMKSLFVLKESMIDQSIPLELNFDWAENQMSNFDDLATNLDDPLIYFFNVESPYFGNGVFKLYYSADYDDGKIRTKKADPFLKYVKLEFNNVSLLEFEFDRFNIYNIEFNLKFFLDSINERLDSIAEMLESCDINEVNNYRFEKIRSKKHNRIIESNAYKVYVKYFSPLFSRDTLDFSKVSRNRLLFVVRNVDPYGPPTKITQENVDMSREIQDKLKSEFQCSGTPESNELNQSNKYKSTFSRYILGELDYLSGARDSFRVVVKDLYGILSSEIGYKFMDLEIGEGYPVTDKTDYGEFALDTVLKQELTLLESNISRYLNFLSKSPAVKANRTRLLNLKENGSFLSQSLKSYQQCIRTENLNRRHLEDSPPIDVAKEYLVRWLREFNIGESLEVNPKDEAFENEVVSLYVVQSNGHKINIANMGTGVSQVISLILAPFQFTDFSNKMLVPKDGGYTTIYLEEPEVNLHPNWQSLLMDLIVDINRTFGINFVIETHSEYMIRKLQYLTASKDSKLVKRDSIIYYLNTANAILENGEEKVKKITIDELGNLSDDFGTGFYDEAINLKFDLLRLNKTQQN